MYVYTDSSESVIGRPTAFDLKSAKKQLERPEWMSTRADQRCFARLRQMEEHSAAIGGATYCSGRLSPAQAPPRQRKMPLMPSGAQGLASNGHSPWHPPPQGQHGSHSCPCSSSARKRKMRLARTRWSPGRPWRGRPGGEWGDGQSGARRTPHDAERTSVSIQISGGATS